jgi:hypothetical protein
MSESLIKPFSKRIDRPVVVTLVIVTIIYNWEFFYYLFAPYSTNSELPRMDLAKSKLSSNYLLCTLFWTVVSLMLLPIFDFLYNFVVNYSEGLKIKADSSAKVKLGKDLFVSKQEERDYYQAISNAEAKIDEARKTVFTLRNKNAIAENLPLQYEGLRKSDKKRLVEVIISFNKINNLNGDDVFKDLKLIDINGDQIRLTRESMSILQKFNQEFPGELE